MLRHESEEWILRRTLRYKDAETWIGDMALAEDPEIHTDPETWILQRFLRYKDAETWMLSHESDTWILHRILRFEDAETWIRRHGLIYGSGDMDLAEDPEIHMDAETWIRRHGSCRGSWDTYGCLYTDPETWILQRSLRYKDAETPETWILQRILRYKWMLRHEC